MPPQFRRLMLSQFNWRKQPMKPTYNLKTARRINDIKYARKYAKRADRRSYRRGIARESRAINKAIRQEGKMLIRQALEELELYYY